MALMWAIAQAQPQPLPNHIPVSIQQIIACALEKDLSKRYQSATAMLADFQMLFSANSGKTTAPKNFVSVAKLPQQFQEGEQLGPYLLIDKLGQGAFGVVWLAEKRGQLATTKFAVKVILEQGQDLELIRKEAEVWAKIGTHPNVVAMIESETYEALPVNFSLKHKK